MRNKWTTKRQTIGAAVMLAALAMALPSVMRAQNQDDPPGRAARLGHIDGSVSFQPAGESEWVEAVPNRPMTTGDKIWADKDSRAEVQLGPTSIRISSNSGMSFLNLDDHTVQIQVSSGTVAFRVRRMDRDDVFEIDTPNQAFSILREGSYRVEASEDGTYTVVTVRRGEGEATGNGQTYTVHESQRATFSGTDQLNADVQQIGDPDDFDRWSDDRDRRSDDSRSSRYVSRDVVGSEDLDDNGDWRPSPEYGNVWYPRVDAGWAPYHTGHWAWVDPWGWTWVDEAPWGYAPFHYGRWASVDGRWGWIPGPIEARPVYAPALVVFVGGGGPSMGGNVAWFPLGPREVYVPSYPVSPAYENRVNISNTTVSQTTVTNVYNTTIVNNNTTVINNVTYANRNVNGAVTAVPQAAFSSAQPVARNAVVVNRQQLATMQVSSRAAVAPSSASVMGAHAATAGRVAAPPQAVQQRQAVAKATPPPPPVAFAAKQQALAAHPGQPVARQELQRLRPAVPAAAQPAVKQAPPGKPAVAKVVPAGTPPPGRPAMNQPAQPGNQPNNQPANRPGIQPPAAAPATPTPAPRPAPSAPAKTQPAQPNRPVPPPAENRPPAGQPNNRPDNNRPGNTPPAQPNRPQPNNPSMNNKPEATPPAPNRPSTPPPVRNDRPPQAPAPENRAVQPPPQNNRPAPAPQQPQRPQAAPPADRPPQRTPPPAETRPPQQTQQQRPQPPPAKPLTPEEKKKQEEEQRKNDRPQ
jgi:hypothetical protein